MKKATTIITGGLLAVSMASCALMNQKEPRILNAKETTNLQAVTSARLAGDFATAVPALLRLAPSIAQTPSEDTIKAALKTIDAIAEEGARIESKTAESDRAEFSSKEIIEKDGAPVYTLYFNEKAEENSSIKSGEILFDGKTHAFESSTEKEETDNEAEIERTFTLFDGDKKLIAVSYEKETEVEEGATSAEEEFCYTIFENDAPAVEYSLEIESEVTNLFEFEVEDEKGGEVDYVVKVLENGQYEIASEDGFAATYHKDGTGYVPLA